jgi:hypothetical protein
MNAQKGQIGMGIIIRDCEGYVLAARSFHIFSCS